MPIHQILLVALVAATACAQPPQVWFGGPFRVGTTPIETLPEVSGIVSSIANSSVLWMHNDSGDEPRIFAVTLPGRVVAQVRLEGAKHLDWEDIAKGPGPVAGAAYLYIADIGDNGARRSTVVIYRIREPRIDTTMRDQQLVIPADSIERFTVAYADGPRDAEALLVDPATGDIVIVTKREQRCRVYVAPAPQSTTGIDTLRYHGDIPLQLVTGGDVSPDGSTILLKTYLHVRLWKRQPGQSLASAITGAGKPLPYMPERQGEAIGMTPAGDGFYTTSECEHGGSAAAIMFYPQAETASAAEQLRDVRLPSISANRLNPTSKTVRIRYTVPDVERISITLRNAAMFNVMTIAEDSAEAGLQERDIDISKLPPGSYAVVLETTSQRVSTLLEVR
ncbi:MAG: hypothetical protein RL594_103 [Bacteroidota bacterium]|jgi:hypothetical protein